MGLRGLWGRPFIPLDHVVDQATLDAVHQEITHALTQVPVRYTGGSHRSMGIMPPALRHTALVDYGEVLAAMSDAEWRAFVALADVDVDAARTPRSAFGEEKEHSLSAAQMMLLKVRHGVYFPWKVFYPLMDVQYWDEKAQRREFTREARVYFPRTVAMVKRLPFVHVGRCNIMGLEGHDHGTVHRDGDPATQQAPDTFITICPVPNKRLFLWDDEAQAKVPVTGRAYWFNDFDFHGVEADPSFRYSIRVDGPFDAAFLDSIRRTATA